MILIAPGKTATQASVAVTSTTPITLALYTNQSFPKAEHNQHLAGVRMSIHLQTPGDPVFVGALDQTTPSVLLVAPGTYIVTRTSGPYAKYDVGVSAEGV